MRFAALILAGIMIGSLAAFSMSRTAGASSLPSNHYPVLTMRPQAQQKTIDDNDDTRVRVQLVVAGAVAALVVGAGSGAYLVRRKLGRTAYTPDASGGGHH